MKLRILVPIVFISTSLFAQKIDINLIDVEVYPRIKVYTTVLNSAGKVVCNVDPSQFQLKEEGEPRRLRVLSGIATESSIGILLDESGSMEGVIDDVREAALRFIDVMSGTDRACTYAFDHDTYPLHAIIDVAVGSNKKALKKSLDKYGDHSGGTDLYTAVVDLIDNDLKTEIERRRAIVALTDGASGGSLETAIKHAKQYRVAIYTIGMGGVNVRALTQLSRATGGKFYKLTDRPTSQELNAVYADIKQRLDCQYTLIYETPSICPDGSTVPIEVSISSFGINQSDTYKRPLNIAQLDFNLFYTIDTKDISFEPPDPVECETVIFSTRIQATSCSDSVVLENVVVRVYDIRPGERVEVAVSEPVEVQSNGSPKTAIVEWNTTGFRDERTLEFVIDPVDSILEKNEEDNILRKKIKISKLTHDLYIKSIDYSPQPAAPCDVVQLFVEVDDGTNCKGMTLNDIEIEAKDGKRSLGRTLTSIKVGEPEAVVFEWDARGFVGHKPLTFIVDPNRKFGVEQTRRNNIKQALIEVNAVKHDLSPTNVQHEPKRPIVGDVVNFQVEVMDSGLCPEIPLGQKIRVRLAHANTKRILAHSKLFSLTTQSNIVVPLSWTTKVNDHGIRNLLFTVDPEGKIREQTPPGKENNSIEYALNVRSMPHDLVIESATITPATPTDGDPAKVIVALQDQARFSGIKLDGVRVKAFERYQKVLLGASELTAIFSQKRAIIEFLIDTGGFAGRRELLIVVDPDNQIEELTPEGLDGDNNNEYVLQVTIKE